MGTRPPSQAAANAARGQALFDEYKASGRRAGAERRLIDILNLRLPRTAGNATAIRNLLASASGPAERIGLIRLLAAQYEATNPTGINHLIAQDLRVLARSADKDVARAATFAFTRLGYVQGFEEVLADAQRASLIGRDDYFGEIAHVLPFAPPADQARLAMSLRQSRNPYAAEIIAMSINSAFLPSTWSPATRIELGLLLQDAEPPFPQSLGLYDIAVAVSYANWLNALATVRASVLNKEGAEFIFNQLNDANVDPRKVMAFLSSEYAPRLFQLIDEKRRYLPMSGRIALYSKQHPQNGDMKEVVALVEGRLAQLPR